MTEAFWSNRFHRCALAAGFIAAAEGRLHESEYVKRLAYDLFESGAFRKRLPNTQGVLADLIADLTHLAEQKGFDPQRILEQGNTHFNTEVLMDN